MKCVQCKKKVGLFAYFLYDEFCSSVCFDKYRKKHPLSSLVKFLISLCYTMLLGGVLVALFSVIILKYNQSLKIFDLIGGIGAIIFFLGIFLAITLNIHLTKYKT